MITKIIGTATTGKCVYDLPEEIKSLEEMRALIYGTYYNPETREELQWQPKLRGLNSPMFNGFQILESGEIAPVIRYEKPSKY